MVTKTGPDDLATYFRPRLTEEEELSPANIMTPNCYAMHAYFRVYNPTRFEFAMLDHAW